MRINIIILMLAFFLLENCKEDPVHHYITYINNSDQDVCCSSHSYLDTVILCGYLFSVKAGTTYKDTSFRGWENILYKRILDVSFFDSKYCIYNMCDSFHDSIKVLKHIELSTDDLEQMNWIITYP